MAYLKKSWLRKVSRRMLVLCGALVLTGLQFLILPIIQSISQLDRTDTLVRGIDSDALEAPPPMEEPEPEKETEEEEPPPPLAESSEPLDLAQLELAMSSSFGDGLGGGDFAIRLSTASANLGDVDAFAGLGDLDQKPRATFLAQPNMTEKMRRKGSGRVTVEFVVNERGRVELPRIAASTDPIFNAACLAAIKQFRFEPGRRGGKAVRSPTKQTFNF